MERPAVSVIVPVFDVEAYLLQALESVLTQDLRDIEVICVDDGSGDRSAFIVEELARTDGRLLLVRQERAGVSAARNRGIQEARGEFLAFLDADDWYEEDTYLSTLYRGATEAGVPAAAGCFVNWWSPERQEREFVGNELLDGYEFTAQGVMAWRGWEYEFGFHRFIFRRSLFQDPSMRFPGLSFYEDPVLLARLLDAAGSFFATDRAHYVYRVKQDSRSFTTAQVLDLMEGTMANLRLAREKRLPLLERYALLHFDDYIGMIGIHLNKGLDLGAVERKLTELKGCVDEGLLAQVGGVELPYRTQMEIMLHPQGAADRLRQAYHWGRYVKGKVL